MANQEVEYRLEQDSELRFEVETKDPVDLTVSLYCKFVSIHYYFCILIYIFFHLFNNKQKAICSLFS